MELRQFLKDTRAKHGLTCIDMAVNFGVSVSFYSYIENGKSYSDSFFEKLANFEGFEEAERKEIVRLIVKRTGRIPKFLQSEHIVNKVAYLVACEYQAASAHQKAVVGSAVKDIPDRFRNNED